MPGPMTQEPMQAAAPAVDIAHAIAWLPGAGDDGLCLSGRESGIWASDDAGVTWRQVVGPDAVGRQVIATSLAFAPDAAGSPTVFAGALGAVIKSIAGGRQWRPVALPEPAPLVTCLAVSPAYEEDGVVLAGTLEDGVLRSDDRGEHWKRWNFGLLDLSVYTIVASPTFAHDETLFAGTETALFKSENGGRSWRETTFPEAAAPVLALAIDDQRTIWAGTDGHGIWRSPDDGASWLRADDAQTTEPINSFVLTANSMLAVLPAAILASHNHGRHWHTASSGISDGGGIAGVAMYPDRAASERRSTAIHERVAGAVDTPSSVAQRAPRGLRDAQRGLQWPMGTPAATAAIALDNSSETRSSSPKVGGGGADSAASPVLLMQLRNGAVRQLRIETVNDTGKESQ